jgi:hypothetical protein
MRLELYISDLLYRYDCVVVPGFGAFLTQRESAKIDASTNAFSPPRKVLSFNAQIKQNDGLLAAYIADQEKLPIQEVLTKIDQQVAEFLERLQSGQTLDFKNIGIINLIADGKLSFEPSYHLNYLTDSFGLAQFNSPVIEREVMEALFEEEDIEVVPVVSPRKNTIAPILKYAAIAVLAITLGGFATSQLLLNQTKQHNKLAQEQADELLDKKIQEATFIIENPLPAITLKVNAPTPKAETKTGFYYIIAGAFKIEANAHKKVRQLKRLGYNAEVVGQNKFGLYEVAYERHTNRNDAIFALRFIQNGENPDAWLLSN